MTFPTGPAPEIPGLAQQVADLIRRVRALETGDGAQPAARAVPVGAFPYSAENSIERTWPGTADLAWRTLWEWVVPLQWARLDLAARVRLVGNRAAQVRVVCDGTPLWTSDLITAAATVEASLSLTEIVAPSAVGDFALEGTCVGGSTGAMYLMPAQLLLRSPRFT